MRNKKRLLILVVLSIYLGFSLYNLFFSPEGVKTLVKLYLYEFAHIKSVAIHKVEGNIVKGVRANDIQLSGIPGIDPKIIVKIQEASVSLPDFNFARAQVKVINGRIELPTGTPLIFQGTYKNKTVDANIYASSIDLQSTVGLFPDAGILKNLSGLVINPDIYIKGSWLENRISGKGIVEKAAFNNFTLVDCPVNFDGTLKKPKDKFTVEGRIVLGQGIFSIKKTGITIQSAKIIYSGDPKKPSFDAKGDTLIGDTKINIVYKGTLDKPDLRLTSEPSLPQDALLIMLVTGEPWKGMGSSIERGQLSPDLARDFLDYVLLGGSGSKLAKKLGISDISFKYDAESKGIKATTSVTDKIGIIYGIEQNKPDGKPETTQYDIGAELKVTDSISLSGETQINQKNLQVPQSEEPKANDKILLKYKTKF
jgi:hypothetical protein